MRLQLEVNKYDDMGSYYWVFDLNEVEYFEYICMIDEETVKFEADLGLGQKEIVILRIDETYSFSHAFKDVDGEIIYDFIGDVTLINDD